MIKISKKYFSSYLFLIVVIAFSILSIVYFKFYNKEKNILKNHFITIDLLTNVHPKLPWEFKPIQSKVKLKIGEVTVIKYNVKNLSSVQTSGIASFNYYPKEFDSYITKINCFCYDIKTLKAGEQDIYSLVLLIDPTVTKNDRTKNIKEVIIQFTFFDSKEFKKIES